MSPKNWVAKLLPFGYRSRRIGFLPQLTQSDCGAACLAMVATFWGRPTGIEEARRVAGGGRQGADARALLEAGRHLGLRGRAVKARALADLRLLPPGSILHWQFRHFVVFESFGEKGAILLDPAMGRREVSLAELDRSFTGIALVFEKVDGSRAAAPARGSSFGRVFARVLAERDLLGRILLVSLLLQVFALALPLATGLLVDRVLPRADHTLLQALAWGTALLLGFQLLTVLVRGHLLLHLRTRLDARWTVAFFEHLVALPYRFFQERPAGDLLMRLGSHSTIRELATGAVLSAGLDGGLVGLSLLLLLGIDYRLALLTLFLGLLRLLVFAVSRRQLRERMSALLQAESASRSRQIEIVIGLETLKACGVEQRAVEAWSHLFVDVLNATAARERWNIGSEAVLDFLRAGSPLILLLAGAHLVLSGDLTLGAMMAAGALAAAFLQPISQLVGTANQLQLMASYLERVEEVAGMPREQEGETLRAPGRLQGKISLQNVAFRYQERSPLVLENLSLEIEAGAFIAIVGRSGAGKTTLAQLLLGMYPPTAGRILYDDQDAAKLELPALRRQLGIVPQKPSFFAGSLRANIALLDPSAPLEKVIAAAKRAHLHEDILAMPMAYETMIEAEASSLSGGQRQRLALARALMQKPRILLLDEATSALDTLTEAAIQKELEVAKATRIVIAHRLSTIRKADWIVVLEEGRIAEQGRHPDLMRAGGLYADLQSSQESRPVAVAVG